MILLKLILAHLIGDFVLQFNSWVKAKENRKLKSWQLYVHIVIHFSLIMLLIWDVSFIKWALLIVAFHLLTDILKLYVQRKHTRKFWFFTDQFLHLIILVIIWMWSQHIPVNFGFLNDRNVILFILCIVFLTKPVSVIIRQIISKWTPETESKESESLVNAGNFIGILERLFVFVFIVTGKWEAVGFLLAAKSIFRFGDLKESKDRKLTEYVLIGTFLSFGIALLTGIIFNAIKTGY
jgi:hypothetical protein